MSNVAARIWKWKNELLLVVYRYILLSILPYFSIYSTVIIPYVTMFALDRVFCAKSCGDKFPGKIRAPIMIWGEFRLLKGFVEL